MVSPREEGCMEETNAAGEMCRLARGAPRRHVLLRRAFLGRGGGGRERLLRLLRVLALRVVGQELVQVDPPLRVVVPEDQGLTHVEVELLAARILRVPVDDRPEPLGGGEVRLPLVV